MASWQRTNGVGGTIKNRVYRDMMSHKRVIKSAEEFSNYANTVENRITSLYYPEPDLLMEPDDTEEAPKIPETLSIHSERFQRRCDLFNPIFQFGCRY